MSPTFVGIGPPRTGSTSLWACLRLHPDIEMARIKEIDWFSRESWNPSTVSFYEQNWRTNAVARGEISTNYFRCVDKILKTYPNIKLIMTERSPVDRFLSSIVMRYKQGTDMPSREEYQQQVEDHLLKDIKHVITEEELEIGLYDQWVQDVPPEQLLRVQAEKLFSNQAEVLLEVFDFLEVRPFRNIPHQRENPSTWRFDFSDDFLTSLEEYYDSK